MWIWTYFRFSSVQLLSRVWPQSCLTLCSMPGLPVHRQLPEFTQTHVHWVGDAIQLSHPLLSNSPPVFNLFQHQGFSNESVLHIRWPKYWSFSFSISPSNEYSGLISFRVDWFDLLASRCITPISPSIFTWLSSFCASSPLIVRLLIIGFNSLLDWGFD